MTNPGPMRVADLFWKGRREAIEQDLCSWCSGPADSFKDAVSKVEYRISGLCQRCQDDIFDAKREDL